jgi:hypothetical protein
MYLNNRRGYLTNKMAGELFLPFPHSLFKLVKRSESIQHAAVIGYNTDRGKTLSGKILPQNTFAVYSGIEMQATYLAKRIIRSARRCSVNVLLQNPFP